MFHLFCMWPMQGAFNKHLELLTHACLILRRVTQTIITFLYTISSTFEIRNLLLKLPWQGYVSCHPVSSLLLVLFFCCKGSEDKFPKNLKLFEGSITAAKPSPPFLSQQLNILTIMLKQKWQVHINLHTISDIHYRSRISK